MKFLLLVATTVLAVLIAKHYQVPPIETAEIYKKKESNQQESDKFESPALPLYGTGKFEVAFEKGKVYGTMKVGDEMIDVYIGNTEAELADGMMKRKFSIIEV